MNISKTDRVLLAGFFQTVLETPYELEGGRIQPVYLGFLAELVFMEKIPFQLLMHTGGGMPWRFFQGFGSDLLGTSKLRLGVRDLKGGITIRLFKKYNQPCVGSEDQIAFRLNSKGWNRKGSALFAGKYELSSGEKGETRLWLIPNQGDLYGTEILRSRILGLGEYDRAFAMSQLRDIINGSWGDPLHQS